MITIDILKAIFKKTPTATLSKFIEPLNETIEHYEINTPLRAAAFIAQIGHESGEFKFIVENLNYSQSALLSIFKKYFKTAEVAAQYARQPEKIANKVYANRMGNGDEASGDGWRYRGRGLIQLTGKNNYTRFAQSLDISLDECVEYLSTEQGAVASAGWFWDNNNLNKWADAKDFIMVTKRINGGVIGLEHRQHCYELALDALQ